MKCPLCSFEFEPSGAACTPACPLAGACHFVCCPQCGYRLVDADQAQSVQWLKKLWSRYVQPPQDPKRA